MYKIRNIFAILAAILLTGGIFFTPFLSAEEDKTLNISGFVDASYSDADFSAGTFRLDQVEIDIIKKLSNKLSLRADINYLASNNNPTFNDIIEQGYLTYRLLVGKGIDLSVGKFNAPIGFELLDPIDMYQFSHSLVFDFGLPVNLTGLKGAYVFTDMIDLTLYTVNGWDNNTDNNHNKATGGRLGITPVKGINVGFSAISGVVETAGNTKDKKTVCDIDLTVTAVDKLIIGGELNSGKEKNAGTATGETDSKWNGLLLMAHYKFTDIYGLTARYDYFNDKGGSRLDSTDTLKEKRTAYTIAPTFSFGEGASMLIEYRYDKSNGKVFGSGTKDNKDTVAVEFTYKF